VILFSTTDALVPFAKRRAMRLACYDGRVTDDNMWLMHRCSHLLAISPIESAAIIFTRDIGHHSSGWWKNPDYERCFHLSISFLVNPTDEPLPFRPKIGERIAKAFYGEDVRKVWCERPYSEEGKIRDVHHYRLFCDPLWTPILPRGEVYRKDETPAGWLSFSELHGVALEDIEAPWLKATST
jgi:hypothetical protein